MSLHIHIHHYVPQDCRTATEVADSSIMNDVEVIQRVLDLLPSTGGEDNQTSNITQFLCGEAPLSLDLKSIPDSLGANCEFYMLLVLACQLHVL